MNEANCNFKIHVRYDKKQQYYEASVTEKGGATYGSYKGKTRYDAVHDALLNYDLAKDVLNNNYVRKIVRAVRVNEGMIPAIRAVKSCTALSLKDTHAFVKSL